MAPDNEPVVDTDITAWTAVKDDLKGAYGYTEAEASERARAILNPDTSWRDAESGEMRVRLRDGGPVRATKTNLKKLAAQLHQAAQTAVIVERKRDSFRAL